MTNQPLSNIIKRDPYSGKIERPTLLLQNNGFETIHKIGNYHNWHFSVKANGIDEISFTVNQYTNNERCPFWDELSDLKIVEVEGYGRFQIKVSYEDATQTIKTVTGQSLEVELGQLPLYLHVNDEEAMDMVKTEYSSDNYTTDTGKFIPTVFYNENDEQHSLLHRVLADKAPHWTIGHVPEYVTKDDSPDTEAELASSFQRTYTVDGTSIYDFLTGEVAQETNVVFIFDTLNRVINVYNLYDCYKDGELIEKAYGEDTSILISKKKLSNQISIESNVDQLKNCFRVTGGDDIITAYVAAVNMSGDNYIHMFSPYQLKEMPKQLSDAIESYQREKVAHAYEYTGEDGIFTRLINAYSELRYLESSMMPKVEMTETTAEEQYTSVTKALSDLSNGVGVYSLKDYNSKYYLPLNRNIKELAEVFLDSRYDVEVVDGTTSYNETDHTWKGVLRFTRTSNKTDVYPVGTTSDDFKKTDTSNSEESDASDLDEYAITLTITEDDNINGKLAYTEQKLYKALAKSSVAEIDFNIDKILAKSSEEQIDFYIDSEIREYFEQFSLNRLNSFAAAYNSCISILSELKVSDISKSKESDTSEPNESDTSEPNESAAESLYKKYSTRYHILTGLTDDNGKVLIEGVIPHRKQQVEKCRNLIKELENEQKEFQQQWNFKNYLQKHNIDSTDDTNELFRIFASYRREDNYSNSNYTSDALVDDNGYINTAECIKKAKELLDTAEKELQKACMLQRTLSCSLNNLLILPEFKNFYHSFAMFNYFRVKTEDELFKMRLIAVDFDESNPSDLSITFSDQMISLGSTDAMGDDIQSILNQASSIATSYPTVTKQAEQGNKAQHTFNELKAQGLNSMMMKIKNSDEEEITITQSGILCKKMNDEGNYGLKQCRITGNVMAFTDDGWQSMRAGIGEMDIKDPFTKETHSVYGFIGDAVIGNILAGQKAWIGDEKGSVIISSKGIKLKGGEITWESPIPQENIEDLTGNLNDITKFQNDVAKSLGLDVTKITSDSVISPKIGGGYLYITDKKENDDNNDCNYVEIDPSGTRESTDNSIFRIHANGKDIMKVTSDGATIAGCMQVTKDYAKIAGWTIGEKSFYNGTSSMSSKESGTYIGTDGIRQYQSSTNFVDIQYGILKATGAEISGKITATSGTIGKCSIDSNGNLQVPSANIKGKITANQINTEGLIAENISADTISGKNLSGCTGDFTGTIKATKINAQNLYSIYDKDRKENVKIINLVNDDSMQQDLRFGQLDKNRFTDKSNYIQFLNDLNQRVILQDDTVIERLCNLYTDVFTVKGVIQVDGGTSHNPSILTTSDIVSQTLISGKTVSSSAVTMGTTSCHPNPNKDGGAELGNPNYRWNNIYCSNATIQTSDRNQKKEIKEIDEKYLQLFEKLIPVSFQFKSGTSGRTHIGFISQDVEQAMKEVGLTDLEFAAFCRDQKCEINYDENGDEIKTFQYDENGEPIYLYSLRYEEFIALNTAIIQKQQSELKSLRDEINAIKEALNMSGGVS